MMKRWVARGIGACFVIIGAHLMIVRVVESPTILGLALVILGFHYMLKGE